MASTKICRIHAQHSFRDCLFGLCLPFKYCNGLNGIYARWRAFKLFSLEIRDNFFHRAGQGCAWETPCRKAMHWGVKYVNMTFLPNQGQADNPFPLFLLTQISWVIAYLFLGVIVPAHLNIVSMLLALGLVSFLPKAVYQCWIMQPEVSRACVLQVIKLEWLWLHVWWTSCSLENRDLVSLIVVNAAL